ncbi:solute carrier family 13 (sodium-dependent dicarboxylate transporter), member 2/3/5 [Halogranum gelatinilyticum]|uniref:Solute carrier family 13 (Sodium-dependent dicarboxylate transporter), member 2/3/5 n=1 Tax=Halogranum gelatinilyticum TaxID=660521 RepID=A0A1G9SJ93_9EURY|nr:DASS family sodium-coupled anion symporter [Halogranum gelatinilyticum]SDM35377.1 solute carrier family 13 (sodium-dependent dicarboxylate transporter), member 2/3/5 [Halogranum gelatinilyticum]
MTRIDEDGTETPPSTRRDGIPGRRRRLGLFAGPLAFLVVVAGIVPTTLSSPAVATLAVTAWVAIWWLSEAVPVAVTSLLPVLLLPLVGVEPAGTVTAAYAEPVVFLFLGGFLLALAIERSGLHRRLAFVVLSRLGTATRRLVLGFMLVAAFLSMWVSNTATAMLLVPVGLAVVANLGGTETDGHTERERGDDPAVVTPAAVTTERPNSNVATALMLAIAYGASIGGVATPIGTPPNAILVGVAATALGVEIGFGQWVAFALPLVAVFLLATWWLLLRLLPPETDDLADATASLRETVGDLGPLDRSERAVLTVFALVAGGWLTRPFLLAPFVPAVSDVTIALVGGVLVFLVPAPRGRGRLLSWEDTARLPWGVLLLFGAGFALAGAFRTSGLDAWAATRMAQVAPENPVLAVLIVATVVVFLTEVTSNTATASLLLPIAASLGETLGTGSFALMVVVAATTSFAFMLPVATPPNAIVFGSGSVTLPQMARVGVWLNLLGVVLVTLAVTLWLPLVFP